MTTNQRLLLALDASSTSIGAVVWDLDNDAVVKHEVWHAKSGATIGQRIAAGVAFLHRLNAAYPAPSLMTLAYEGPAYRTTPLALIAQQRMVGMVLYVAHEVCLPTIEVTPSQVKKALTGSGNASKALMEATAKAIIGTAVSEHVADALGVALAASGMIKHREYAV